MVLERRDRKLHGRLWDNEFRNRILRSCLWVLAGAALVGVLVFMIVVAPSLLIGTPPKGLSAADELKARNDVRATLVQGLAGLAVAGGLAVTYRTYRQNRAEQDRTYERELYAKAVEQLGHEKAPVRLGALHSLERLADDKPERRPIIVDVICAYLRMPFSPTASATKPEPEATEAPEMPAAETDRRTEGTGDAWQQERQVRLTAQRILAEHLRNDTAVYKRSTNPPRPNFWPGMSLNLAGATLINFELYNGVVADADFRRATFTGRAVFGGTTFTSRAEFEGAAFTGEARFDEAAFTAWALFSGATFTGDARFDRATFTLGAEFDKATFTGDAEFHKAAFTGEARFFGVTFTGETGFFGVTFTSDARFDRATFTGDTRFSGAGFRGEAWFDSAAFTGGAEFDGAVFFSGFRFSRATFSRAENSLTFEHSRVLSPDAQHVWPTGWCLGPPDGIGGYTVVRADDGLDTGLEPEAPPAAGRAGGA